MRNVKRALGAPAGLRSAAHGWRRGRRAGLQEHRGAQARHQRVTGVVVVSAAPGSTLSGLCE